MNPERARELYANARSMEEVIELFESRPERTKEVNLLKSLHPKHISDPMSVVRILRGMAQDDEEAHRRYTDEAVRAADLGWPEDARKAERLAELRMRRAKALIWAASALTRGYAMPAKDASNPP